MSWESDRRELLCPCGGGTVIVCSGSVSDDWNRFDHDPRLVERRVVCARCPQTEETILEALRLEEGRRESLQRSDDERRQAAWRTQLHALTDLIEDDAKAWMAIKTRLGGHRAWVNEMTSKEFVGLARKFGRAETIRIAATRIRPTIFDLDFSEAAKQGRG